MRLQFLGSGDAFGSGGRFNTCFHLERQEHGHVLIDCGASSMVAIRKWAVEPNAVSNYVTARFGAKGSRITAEDVRKLRDQQ